MPRSAYGSSKAQRLAGCRSAALAAPCSLVCKVPLCALTQVGHPQEDLPAQHLLADITI